MKKFNLFRFKLFSNLYNLKPFSNSKPQLKVYKLFSEIITWPNYTDGCH